MESIPQNVTNITATEKYGMNRNFLSCYHFNVVHFNLGDISPGWYIFSCILNAVFSVTATVANLLVLTAIRRTPTLHSPSNTLLLGLALSDLGVGLIVHPIFHPIAWQSYTEQSRFLQGWDHSGNHRKRSVYHFPSDCHCS